MISPAEVHSAYDLAYAVAIPLYFLLGYSGFYAFGVFNSGAAPPYHPASPHHAAPPYHPASPHHATPPYHPASPHHAAPYPATPLAMLHPLPGANFLLNFPDGAPVRALMVATAVFGYLPLSYGSILLFLKVTRGCLGTSPSPNPNLDSRKWSASVAIPLRSPSISLRSPSISLRSPSDLPPISI